MNEARSLNGKEATGDISDVIHNSVASSKNEQPLRKMKCSGVLIPLDSLSQREGAQQISTKGSKAGQPAKNKVRKAVPPAAWNHSEVSGTAEARITRKEMRSESKVTSMRSSLFRKKMSDLPGQDPADEEPLPDNSPEAKKKNQESILKRMADLDAALGVN